MTPDTDTPARAQEARAADWQLRRNIGNALGLKPFLAFDWAYFDEDNTAQMYPAWDTDLNAAWTLTEPYAFDISTVHHWEGKAGYIASISDKWERDGIGRAETPALAICRAFLEYHKNTATPAAPAGDD